MSLQCVSATTKSTPEVGVDQARLEKLRDLFPHSFPLDLIRIIFEYHAPISNPTLARWYFAPSSSHKVVGIDIQKDASSEDSVLAYHLSTAKNVSDVITELNGFNDSKPCTLNKNINLALPHAPVHVRATTKNFAVKFFSPSQQSEIEFFSRMGVHMLHDWTQAIVWAGYSRSHVFSYHLPNRVLATTYVADARKLAAPAFKSIPELHANPTLFTQFFDSYQQLLVAFPRKIYNVAAMEPHVTQAVWESSAEDLEAIDLNPDATLLFTAHSNRQLQFRSLPTMRVLERLDLEAPTRSISAAHSTLGLLSVQNKTTLCSVWDISYARPLYQFTPTLTEDQNAIECQQGEWAYLLNSFWTTQQQCIFALYDTRTPGGKAVSKTTTDVKKPVKPNTLL